MPFGELPAPPAPAPPRPISALEAELTTLAGHLTAATYRLLVLIEEFDRRGGWAGWGVRSCAHWLSWKCGVGMVAAREKVRVARALPALPLVADAMRTGKLSYAKVRAITRMASADNESALLSIALNGTATHVENVVRAYRRTAPVAEQREQALKQQSDRGLTCYWDHDGCLVVQGRLPPEQGALVMKALAAADQALCADEPAFSATAPAVPGQNASAESSAGAAHSNAVDASAEAGPVREGRSWKCRQGDALALLAETTLARGAEALPAGERHTVQVHVDLDALRETPAGAQPRENPRCCVDEGPALASDVARRLACDGGVLAVFENADGAPLSVGRKTRAIPPALRRALASRDGGCRFPGCTCTRFVDAHHLEHWAEGGETRLDNLALLCRFHHRLVHEGGFTVAQRGALLVFRRPDGREVPQVPRPVTSADGADAIPRKHQELGLAIDARTSIPGWGGERLDYTWTLSMLEQRARRGQAAPSRDDVGSA